MSSYITDIMFPILKEFYVIWLDEDDIPKGVVAGPFQTHSQAQTAVEALSPMFEPTKRLCPVGGDLGSVHGRKRIGV